MRTFAVMGVALGLLVFAGGAGAYEETEVADGGSISGVVKYAGKGSEKMKLLDPKHHEACTCKEVPNEDLIVGEEGVLKNAVVYLKKIERGKKKPTGKVVVDQKCCVFVPHVVPVMVGQTVEFRNSDPTSHNVLINTFYNEAMNKSIAEGGAPLDWTPKAPDKVKISCTMHEWMSAYLIVMDHPYVSITDDKGRFKIDDIPPGTYEVRAWQESLGLLKTEEGGKKVRDWEVKVEAGKETVLELPTFQPK